MTWPGVTDIQNPRIFFFKHWRPYHIPKVSYFPLKHCSRGAVGKLFCSWVTWPDLVTWPCMTLIRNFQESCEKDAGSDGWKPGGSARRRIFAILDKPEGGGGRSNAPPQMARVKQFWPHRVAPAPPRRPVGSGLDQHRFRVSWMFYVGKILRAERQARSEFFCGLTFALLGGVWTPPLRFFADSKKKKNVVAQRRRVFTYLIPDLFGNFCKSFDPGSCKVRSPGQVKWPYLTKTLQSRPSYSV